MSSFAKISIRFSADLKQFSSQMENAQRSMQKVGKKMQTIGAGMTVGLTLPIIALGAKSVQAFDKQAKALAQVEAGLKSTGNAAGFTSEQLQKMASDLQNNSLFGDEEILQGATAQLLTFTNIAGDQFARTQQAALDLATRLDGDLKSASIQLGKALNDPVANLSALSRSGIQFSKDQKAMINSLAETGRLAEAQNIILDELQKQYGGAAEAASKAGLGPFKQFNNILGDITEEFGAMIVDAINPFIAKLKDIALSFQKLSPETKKMIAIIAGIVAALGPLLVALGLLMTTVIPGLITAFSSLTAVMLANPFGVLAVAIGVVAGSILLLNSRLGSLTDSTKEFAKINATAAKSIAEERLQIEQLIRVAQNEKVSKEERLKAIENLNRIVPEYNNQLSLETINTDEANSATKRYITSLLQKAKVQAAQEKLVQVEKELLDLQLGQNDAVKPSLWQNASNAMTSFGNSALFAQKAGQTIVKNLNQEEKALNDLKTQLVSFLDVNSDLLKPEEKEVTVKVTPKFTGTGALGIKQETLPELELRLSTEDAQREFQGISELIQNTGGNIDLAIQASGLEVAKGQLDELYDSWLSLEELPNPFTQMEQNAIAFNEGLSSIMASTVENFAAGFGQLIGSAFEGGITLGSVFSLIGNTLADLAIQVGQMAIGIGIAVVGIKKALQSLAGPVAIAAGVALVALGSFAKSALANLGKGGSAPGVQIPALASGGIAYGPTLAYVGEYAGASANPEVIAPLDKLKAMIADTVGNGGVQHVKVSGVLKGTDMHLQNARTDNYIKRLR